MHRALPALAAVALLATGCASRGSVRQVQDDLAGLHADVSELRHSYELSARELARMMEELRALDARNAELQAAIREQGAEAACLRARLDAAEQELRETRTLIASPPPVGAPAPRAPPPRGPGRSTPRGPGRATTPRC